ncbi:MAG: DUF4252 domain-containing protein [Bacteroidales bacterium]|nr:DUF4252 domain-containing protein [Bacteroidales bacterium]
MKRLTLLLLGLLPVWVLAQNMAADKLYEKYAGQENITAVNISSEMFQMMAGMEVDTANMEDEEAKQVMEAVSKMDGMKILTYKKEDKKDNSFYKDVKNTFDPDNYVEMMSIKDNDSDVKFYARRKGDKISELLMIADDPGETVFMNFSGLFDMKTISEIGRNMDMHGMDKLEKMEEKK